MKDRYETENNCSEERPYNLQLQDEIDYVTLGHHLRDVRKAHPYTQAQISEILGLKPNYYGQYETGARHINLPRFIQFICKTQCSADFLLMGCHKDYPSSLPARQEYSETRKEINSILDKCDDELLKDLIIVAEFLRKRR